MMNKELQIDNLPQHIINSHVRQVREAISKGAQLIQLQHFLILLEEENGRIPDEVKKELNKCVS